MGLAVTVHELHKHIENAHIPRAAATTFTPFPAWRRRPPGSLVMYFKALPPSIKLPREPDGLFWVVDCQFLPNRDNSMVVSVGAYIDRPNHTPLTVTPQVQGLIYRMSFTDRLKCEVIRRTRTNVRPRVHPHPNGDLICFVGVGTINVMSLNSLDQIVKEKDGRFNSFQYCTVAPNGLYLASLARLSKMYEVCVMLLEGSFFITQGLVKCHQLCPGFIRNQFFTDRVECKFSPDSAYLAVASSLGMLFVIRSVTLEKRCGIVPGMFEINDVKLSNERSFDFDPRYKHALLAFGSGGNKVYICDIDQSSVVKEIGVDTEGSIECLQYGARGEVIAVATSEAVIHIMNPDNGSSLYLLDGTAQGPNASMQLLPGNMYPTILHMSFTRAGDNLAVSSTDGIVRVWQLEPNITLQHLCRMAIRQYTPNKTLHKLPLPSKLIQFLLEIPE